MQVTEVNFCVSGSRYHRPEWSLLLYETERIPCEYKWKYFSSFISTAARFFLLSRVYTYLWRPVMWTHEYVPDVPQVCSISLILAVVLVFQVHMSSLGRESSGSPILIAENVTSATTHVTKVEKHWILLSVHYLIMIKWVLQREEAQLISFVQTELKVDYEGY